MGWHSVRMKITFISQLDEISWVFFVGMCVCTHAIASKICHVGITNPKYLPWSEYRYVVYTKCLVYKVETRSLLTPKDTRKAMMSCSGGEMWRPKDLALIIAWTWPITLPRWNGCSFSEHHTCDLWPLYRSSINLRTDLATFLPLRAGKVHVVSCRWECVI